MAVCATQVVDVQGDLGMIDQTLKKLAEQVHVEVADHGPRKRHVKFQPGATGEIDHHARQRLIQRHVGVPVASNAFFVAHRDGQSLAQRDAEILDRVVGIDMQIAPGPDADIQHAVARDLIQHVFEKGQAGLQLCHAAAIQVQGHADLCLQGIAAHLRPAL